MSVELNATITRRDEINHGLLVLQVTPDFELPRFRPGQYAVLGLPAATPRVAYADPEPEADAAGGDRLIRRAYSIASSSLQGRHLEFYVALVRSGELTPRLFALKEGDRVWLGRKVVGMFTLDDAPAGHDIVFVATGTGLAPYISMLRSAYRFEDGHRTVVVHGARTSWDLGYRGELAGLAARYQNLHYLPIIDEPGRDASWQGPVGFVYRFFEDGTVDRVLGHELDPERTSAFLCGNPLMIQGMERLLTGRGFRLHSRREPGTIFVEKYWAD